MEKLFILRIYNEYKDIFSYWPSGAGKDTLIKLAKEYLKDNKEIIFLKRYITRKPDKNEENYYLSREAFFILEKSGFFFTTWKAYNNLYGISFNEICLKNKKVIISISRKKVSCFERKFNYVHTLYITESVEKIEERLNMRKREPDDMIKRDCPGIILCLILIILHLYIIQI